MKQRRDWPWFALGLLAGIWVYSGLTALAPEYQGLFFGAPFVGGYIGYHFEKENSGKHKSVR